MKSQTTPYFHSNEATRFLTILQEATRAKPDRRDRVFIPPTNAGKANSEYHHLVFGQRGSGKSTLLRELQKDRLDSGRLAVWLDQEIFGNLSYPDVLVSSVEAVILGVSQAVRSQHNRVLKETSPWRRLFTRPSKAQRDLIAGLDAIHQNLRILKFAPVESTIEWTRSHSSTTSAGIVGTISIRQAGVGGSVGTKDDRSVKSVETVVSSKKEFLERSLIDFKSLLYRAAKTIGGGAIFLDDVYHLTKEDQPRVLGYMHRLVKDSGFWLKIGSIRY